jgi:WD40 repeat protein
MRLQKFVLGICASVLAILLVRCGSSNGSTTPTPTPTPTPSNPNPTKFKKRVLVSVISPSGGAVFIVDGTRDVLATQTVAVTDPAKMVTAGGETVMRNSTLSEITIFNNPGEVVFFNTQMQDQPFDVAITSDGKTAFAAIKNKGVVEGVDTATGNITSTISVPTPARLVMSPNGTKLLVFSDDPQTIAGANKNAFFVIDVATAASNPVATAIPGPGLDQPYIGVFNGSETKAFILNCGPECGGTTASVVPVDFSSAAPAFSTAIPVAGATVGMLSGSSLFVAGTPTTPPAGCNFAACGTISVINTGSLTVSNTAAITDGLHQVMAMSAANHLYIGAADCTVGPISAQSQVQSCLSIFNTTTNATTGPVLETALRTNFNVTGLQQISGRNVMYVVQGGALDFFDTTTDNVSTSIQAVNISGTAIDVLQIDP